MHRDDDEAWRAIVDNYGDRVELEDPAPAPEASPEPLDHEPDESADTLSPTLDSGWDEDAVDADHTSDRFVPPPAPPLPRTTPDRYVAWAGVFGSPVLLLLSVVLGFDLPELVAYLLVIGFVGGFLYLVFQMPREPRDPNDDGARL